MKISLNWLSDYVDFTETDPQKIGDALTLSVAEVYEVEEQGALLKGCCIGKILEKGQHPNADRLSVCTIETDQGKKKIVCGGTNLREGMLIAFAHVGTSVRHGDEIVQLTKMKIRGEESEGMICASEELELDNLFPPKPEDGDRPVIDLGDDGYNIGDSLRDAFDLTDTIFHIDNHSITHRADLFSQIGFARECIAIGLGKAKKSLQFDAPKFGTNAIPFDFVIDAPKGMPRYCACMIEIDNLGETPDWMKKKLEATGWRSLTLPIDITNFVAMEVGVPLHSFDADDFKGDVHMRYAKKGEKITTLDEVERELNEGALILSDDDGIFDLLGIMGGLRSSTKDSTRRIYLHSASLDPMTIRKTILATGHRTDAATVYEKGVPHITTEQGFFRAAQLFLELVPGARIVSQMESVGDNGAPKPIEIKMERVQRLLGREVSQEEAMHALQSLEFDVNDSAALRHFDKLSAGLAQGDTVLQVTPPLYRLGDVSREADIIEEVARVTGFASYESQLPAAPVTIPPRNHTIHVLRDELKEAGYYESIRYAFIGEELLKNVGMDVKDCEVIENPIGEDMKIMRPSLLPSLLEAAEQSMRLCEDDLKLFETGHVYRKGDEPNMIMLLHVGAKDESLVTEPVLQLKQLVGNVFEKAGYKVRFKRIKNDTSYIHPGRQLSIEVHGKTVGSLFELHPTICTTFGLPHRAAACEVDLEKLFARDPEERIYKPISQYPIIAYDTTVALPRDVTVASVIKKAQEGNDILQHIELSKIYEKDGKRNLTFRCTYGSFERTLTEEEVKPIHEKVESLLQS